MGNMDVQSLLGAQGTPLYHTVSTLYIPSQGRKAQQLTDSPEENVIQENQEE